MFCFNSASFSLVGGEALLPTGIFPDYDMKGSMLLAPLLAGKGDSIGPFCFTDTHRKHLKFPLVST
jgi:hypothetical protein